MTRMLMGMETEYGAGVFGASPYGGVNGVCGALLDRICRRYAHVSDSACNGVFLGNGARLYNDCSHPEYSTPECSSPRELVTHLRAGERLLAQAAREGSFGPRQEVGVFRSNQDYLSGTTWGCHESYLFRNSHDRLARALIPHLVSRVIYTGAGGFTVSHDGPAFTLSPRAWKLDYTISQSSTEGRGIVNTKDEPLSRTGTHRLHLICGESLCSDLAALLKIGTTALVVAIADMDWPIGVGLGIAWPVPAMQAIAADPTCRARVHMLDGSMMSAIEIQRGYLRQVNECRRRRALPDWADEIIELWSSTLDNLERDAAWAERTLDWGIRRALFERQIGPDGWSRLKQDAQLQYKLFELDVRFGQLGARGIFEQLQLAGVLNARLINEADITRALTHPPSIGRARIRGTLIRQLAALGTAGAHACDWTGLWNTAAHNYVDLSDPFEERIEWRSTDRSAVE